MLRCDWSNLFSPVSFTLLPTLYTNSAQLSPLEKSVCVCKKEKKIGKKSKKKFQKIFKMGEDVRFARNSQKNIRELIGRHEMAQTEYG